MIQCWNYSPTKGVFSIIVSHQKKIINYDDVVDRSSFRPDKENIRAYTSNNVGSDGKGVYDDPNNMPSITEVQIRSGKLDKAEVSQLQILEQQRLKKLAENKSKQQDLDNLKKINEARQEYIDRKTGFSGQPME